MTQLAKRPILELREPVNRSSTLNRGLVGWWMPALCACSNRRLYDLCRIRNTDAFDANLSFSDTQRFSGWPYRVLSMTDENPFGSACRANIQHSDLYTFQQGFSLSAWVRPTSIPSGGYDRLFFTKTYSPSTNPWYTYGLGFGRDDHAFYMMTGHLDPVAHTVPRGLANKSLNVWYHVVGTFEGAGKKKRIYVNGVQEGSADALTTSLAVSIAEPLSIGTPIHALYTTAFRGEGTDFRLFSGALTAEEVFSIYEDSLSGYKETLNWYTLVPTSVLLDVFSKTMQMTTVSEEIYEL